MADEKIFKFDEAKFKELVAKQREYLNTFVGKPQHNPYFRLNQLDELERKFTTGERTPELFAAAVALKEVPPVVCAPPTVPAEVVAKEIAKAQAGALSGKA